MLCLNYVWISLLKTRFICESGPPTTDYPLLTKPLHSHWKVFSSPDVFHLIILYNGWPALIAAVYNVRGLWLATGYGLLYRALWELFFCAFVIIIITHYPSYSITYSSTSFLFSSLYLSLLDSTRLLCGPQRCPFLISSLLFYSFFHFLNHLSCLTLTVYLNSLSSSPFAFLQALCCSTPLQTHSIPFHPNCSFPWTLQLCCSAFRRC